MVLKTHILESLSTCHCQQIIQFNSHVSQVENVREGAGGMTKCLRACTTLPEDLSSTPKYPILGDSQPAPGESDTSGLYKHLEPYVHIYKNRVRQAGRWAGSETDKTDI